MRKINLLEAIVLSIPIALTGCAKIVSPLGTTIDNEVEIQSCYNGGSAAATITPQNKQYSKIEAKVNDGDYEELTSNNGKYTKTITNATNGEYQITFKIDSGVTETEKIANVPVYMDEDQSDTALGEALSVLVNSSPAVNDIKNYQINYTELGHNWDTRIWIEKGSGNTGMFFIDCQGSNSESSKAAVMGSLYPGAGYKFITPEESNSTLSQNLKDHVTTYLLDQKSKGWPTITSW